MPKTMCAVLVAVIVATASAQEPATITKVGSFAVLTSKDEISGKDVRSVSSDVGERQLTWLCDVDGNRLVAFVFERYMVGRGSGFVDIQYRFASEAASAVKGWRLTGTHKAAKTMTSKNSAGPDKGKTDAEVFTALALKNDSVVMRVSDRSDGEEITETFPLLELRKALAVLPCYAPQLAGK